MNIDHIIVQAGGKGTRLGYLTKNKPKALVPVHNLPLLFHLFQKFPEKKFIIIADYQKEVLREYLECFSTVKYQVVDTPPPVYWDLFRHPQCTESIKSPNTFCFDLVRFDST